MMGIYVWLKLGNTEAFPRALWLYFWMNCCCNFSNKKVLEELLGISYGALKLSRLPESDWLFPPCVHIFICLARAVVSWAFVSVGFTLWWPGTILLPVFLVLSTLGEGLKQSFSVGLEKPWQYGFFIWSSMLLCFDSLFPHLSLEKKKKRKRKPNLGLILKWLLFQL